MFQLRIQRGPYLLAIVTGSANLGLYVGIAKLIAEVARQEGTRDVLLDLMGVANMMSEQEHGALARLIAPPSAGLRIAVALPTPDRQAAGDRVAREVGEHLRIFGNVVEAEEWLLSTPNRVQPGTR